LRLPATAVVVILAGDRGEHVEQHVVDGLEHAERLTGILTYRQQKECIAPVWWNCDRVDPVSLQ
jgi:hypothetical protein